MWNVFLKTSITLLRGVNCKFLKSWLFSAGNSLFAGTFKVFRTSWTIAVVSFFKKFPRKCQLVFKNEQTLFRKSHIASYRTCAQLAAPPPNKNRFTTVNLCWTAEKMLEESIAGGGSSLCACCNICTCLLFRCCLIPFFILHGPGGERILGVVPRRDGARNSG
jgi:hypothetical protein